MQIGYKCADITPSSPVELAGYGYMLDRHSHDVESPLTAYALALQGSDGKRAAMCGVDLVSVDQDTVQKVQRSVAEQLDGEDIPLLINASHTHSGPASHLLHGAGGYNPEYIDGILIPHLSNTIVRAFKDMSDGEIGISRGEADGHSYNRTGEVELDTRVTAIRVDTEKTSISGANFACHPTVYGKDSRVISSDYPGAVRATLKALTGTNGQIWQTGCAGDVDPLVNQSRKGNTTSVDVEELGTAIGEIAAELYKHADTTNGSLQTVSDEIHIPVNLDFELDPEREVEVYRDSRHLPKGHDLSGLLRWYAHIAPTINEFSAETIAVPITVIRIGSLAFLGFGAEIYNQTGRDLEDSHPETQLVTMMNVNEHRGYVPRIASYQNHDYAARASAFIFGRKPLTPDSEKILRDGVSTLL